MADRNKFYFSYTFYFTERKKKKKSKKKISYLVPTCIDTGAKEATAHINVKDECLGIIYGNLATGAGHLVYQRDEKTGVCGMDKGGKVIQVLLTGETHLFLTNDPPSPNLRPISLIENKDKNLFSKQKV